MVYPFNSHLTYGSQVWGQAKVDLMKKLSILQNKALRIIHFKPPRESANNLYIDSKILKHADQIRVLNCLLAFSFLKGLLPCSFQNFLTPVSVTHEHNTKSTKLKFQVQRTKTLNYGTNLVKNKTISTWNDEIGKLNIKINETSKSSFRHKLITHFSQKYNNDT